MSLVWLPLAQSGVASAFSGGTGVVKTLSDIVAVNQTSANSAWTLQLLPTGTARTARLVSNAFASTVDSTVTASLGGIPYAPVPNGDPAPAVEFLPNPVPLVNVDTIGFAPSPAGTFSYDFTVELLVNQPDTSIDPGRTTRGYMSAYAIHRTQMVRIRRYNKRTLETVLPGNLPNLPDGVIITSAQWLTTAPWVVFMTQPRLVGLARRCSITIEGNYAGFAWIKCLMTLSNGEVWNYEYEIEVTNAPLYPSDTYLPSAGPFIISTP